MNDGRQTDLAERANFGPQRAGRKAELIGDPHQAAERRAGERERKSLTQAIQIDVVAVVAGNHGHAGQAAFRRFGSQDRRKSMTAADMKLFENAHRRPATA